MQTNDAIKQILTRAGLTPYSASLKIGKSHAYIGSLLKRAGGVGAPVLASIADICGYDLFLVSRENPTDMIKLDASD